MSIKIKCTSDDILLASASDKLGTTTTSSDTNITVACGSYPGKVRYLRSPYGKKSFINSIALSIMWDKGNEQVEQQVMVMVKNKKILNVVWEYNNTVINENSGWTSIPSGGTITVNVDYGTSTSSHSGISNLALYQYYVSKKGTVWNGNGTVATSNNSVGSWSNPGKARHAATSTHFTGTQYYYKDFTFTPPSIAPNYYIIIAYKGWKDGVGHIRILEGDANSFQDQTVYWDDGWGKYIRYSFYAIYSDGTAPGISTDATIAANNRKGTGRGTATATAMWIQFAAPPTLYEIHWYRQNKSTHLIDGNRINLSTRAVNGTKIIIPAWEGYDDNYLPNNKEGYSFDGWYTKEGTGSWSTSTYTNNEVSATGVEGKSLYFALKLKINTYTITYNDTATTTSNITKDYNTTLTINPYGNLESGTVTHTKPDGSGTYTGTGSYSITVTKNMTIAIPTCTSGWIFIGWTVSGNTITAKW